MDSSNSSASTASDSTYASSADESFFAERRGLSWRAARSGSRQPAVLDQLARWWARHGPKVALLSVVAFVACVVANIAGVSAPASAGRAPAPPRDVRVVGLGDADDVDVAYDDAPYSPIGRKAAKRTPAKRAKASKASSACGSAAEGLPSFQRGGSQTQFVPLADAYAADGMCGRKVAGAK